MNLFILSTIHDLNAQYHVDKHVVKMPIEATQLLSTVAREWCDMDIGYKSTYINHPVTKWVGACQQNFLWTAQYAKALFIEYSYRWDKSHKSASVLNEIMRSQQAILDLLPDLGGTPHHLAVSPELKHLDPVLAYRAYYLKNKKRLFVWTRREVPSWVIDPQYEIREYI